jgi:hypothetical protein
MGWNNAIAGKMANLNASPLSAPSRRAPLGSFHGDEFLHRRPSLHDCPDSREHTRELFLSIT